MENMSEEASMSEGTEYKPPHPDNQRHVFVLRIWQHKGMAGGWIAEVHDVSSGQLHHVHGLEALFDFLKGQIVGSPQENSNQDNKE
jgi:hypothetical protein